MYGKHAVAISDRSGRKYPYKDMVLEWTGVLVHKDEYEEKHPQLTPARPGPDSQALPNARPPADVDTAVPTWHLLTGVGVNTTTKDTQIADVGLWTMHHGDRT